MIKIEYNALKNGYIVITPVGYIKRFNNKDYSFTYTIHHNTANTFDLATATRYKNIIENIMDIMNVCEYPES